MGTAYGPEIVTDSLELVFDAANVKSYPGSGTDWTDATGNGWGEDFTVGGTTQYAFGTSPSRITTNVGDNTSTYEQRINITTSPSTLIFADEVPHSFECWVKLDSNAANTHHSIAGRGATTKWLILYKYNSSQYGTRFRFDESGGPYTNMSATSVPIIGTWMQFVMVFCRSGRSIDHFCNGTLINTDANTTNDYSTAAEYKRLAAGYASSTYRYNFQGDYALARVYSKALSSAEVLQNFNAVRGRFGV